MENYKHNEHTEEQLYNIESLSSSLLHQLGTSQTIEEFNFEQEVSNEEPMKRRTKKLVKKQKKEDDYQEENRESDDEDLNEEEDDDVDDQYDENEPRDDKMLSKKRERPQEKKKEKQKKSKPRSKKHNVREYFADEAERGVCEESEESDEITGVQKEQLMRVSLDRDIHLRNRNQLSLPDKDEEAIEDYFHGKPIAQELDEDYVHVPSYKDPKLWLVKCETGKERDFVNNLYHKYFDLNKEDTNVK
jgi:hypothetical protein